MPPAAQLLVQDLRAHRALEVGGADPAGMIYLDALCVGQAEHGGRPLSSFAERLAQATSTSTPGIQETWCFTRLNLHEVNLVESIGHARQVRGDVEDAGHCLIRRACGTTYTVATGGTAAFATGGTAIRIPDNAIHSRAGCVQFFPGIGNLLQGRRLTKVPREATVSEKTDLPAAEKQDRRASRLVAAVQRSSDEDDVFEIYAEDIDRETAEWINSL